MSSDPGGSELAEAGPEPDTPNLVSDQALNTHLLSLRSLQGDSKSGVEAICFVCWAILDHLDMLSLHFVHKRTLFGQDVSSEPVSSNPSLSGTSK